MRKYSIGLAVAIGFFVSLWAPAGEAAGKPAPKACVSMGQIKQDAATADGIIHQFKPQFVGLILKELHNYRGELRAATPMGWRKADGDAVYLIEGVGDGLFIMVSKNDCVVATISLTMEQAQALFRAMDRDSGRSKQE